MFFFVKVKKNLRQPDGKLSKMLLMNLAKEEILTRVSLLIDTGFVRFLCQIIIDILLSVNFARKNIWNSCSFHSWVYNQVTLWSISFSTDFFLVFVMTPNCANTTIETWAKVVKESFRKVRAFTIYKTDKQIISKNSQSLKTTGSVKSTVKFYFF